MRIVRHVPRMQFISRPVREGSYGMYGWWLGALSPTAAGVEVEEKPSIGLYIGRSCIDTPPPHTFAHQVLRNMQQPLNEQ